MQRRVTPTVPPLGDRTGGMTLLELVVAVLVLAIGSMAVLKALDQSRRALGGAMPRLLAQVAVQNRAEEQRLLGLVHSSSLSAQVQMGPHQITLSQRRETTASGVIRVEISARIQDAPGAYLVTYLPPPGVGS